MKKRKILMLILFVSTVLLSGCGKTFLSRLFKSEHEEYAEILTAFLAAANQNDTKKIEELFAPNIRGKEFQKEVDDILLGVTGSQDRDLYRVMHSSIELKKDNKNYYIYMEVVTADKENSENKGIQIIDLATKKAYDDRYFLWHSKQGIYAQEKACEDYQSMLIYGNVREYYTVDRELSVDYFKNFLKRSTSYKELQNEIGEPNGELINDEFVYEITQGANEKTYITCEVLGDEIIKLEVCNEEKVIETIYEKNSEEN